MKVLVNVVIIHGYISTYYNMLTLWPSFWGIIGHLKARA